MGPIELIALGLNGVVGVGIFFVPAAVARQVSGTAGAMVYAATALACLPIALAFARLGNRFDEDGGPYVFAREAFGPRAAFVVGWLACVSAIFSTSAVIRGLAQSLPWNQDAGSWGVRATASLIVLLLAAIVAAGLKISAWAWTGVTVAKILPLVTLLIVALAFVPVAPATATPAPEATGELLRASLIVLFALQGFEIVAVPAGHVKRPGSVAIATVVALAGATLLYVGLHLACVRALPGLGASKAPLVDAATAYGGQRLGRLLSAGTSVSALGIALGMVAMTPRYLAALGRRDGFGPWLGVSNARGVPTRALAITAFVVFCLVQIGSLDELFAMSSIAVLAQYGSTAGSLIRLGVRKFRGLGKRDIVLGILASATTLAVVSGAHWKELARAAVVIVAGVVLKVAVSRRPGQA
ncbi:MAG: APC family permease [Deltaproteobacteria bacterium]|nr:APC family permease [Deltaproteobacteria bacterium]